MWEEQEIRLAQISTIGDVEYPEESLRLQALESNGPEPQLPASIPNIIREAVNDTGCSAMWRKSLARGNKEGVFTIRAGERRFTGQQQPCQTAWQVPRRTVV